MNRLFLGLAVVLLCVGGLALLLGIAAFAGPFGGGGGPAALIVGIGGLSAGVVCLFAMAVLDRLDALATINRDLLSTVRGDQRE